MPNLVTPDLVNQAVRLVLPYAQSMCREFPAEGMEGVVFIVDGELLEEPVIYLMEEMGPEESWISGYGYNPLEIAKQKIEISLRTGRSSGDVITSSPWRLSRGNSRYAGAVAEDTDLAVSVSGSYEWVDVCLAWCLFNTITGLCAQQVDIASQRQLDTL